MADTATRVRYFRLHGLRDEEGPRIDGDTKCEYHSLKSLNSALGYTFGLEVQNVDDGMNLINLISKINGHNGVAITEEDDVEFQVCPDCRREADQQKAAS